MAVYCISGVPGSGKSLYLVARVIAPLLTARDLYGNATIPEIYHNIEGLRGDILAELLKVPAVLVSQRLHHFSEFVSENGVITDELTAVRFFYAKPETLRKVGYDATNKRDEYSYEVRSIGAVFIIDEAQNYFSSRDFKETFSYELIRYLSRHRHYNHCIYWTSQNDEQVDITFRRQTETIHFLERLDAWGPLGGRDVTKISKYEGWVGPKGGLTPFVTEKWKRPSKFFICYSSYVTGSSETERRAHDNIFTSSKGVKIVAVLFLIALTIGLSGIYRLKTGKMTLQSARRQAPAVVAKQPSQAQASEAQPSVAVERSEDGRDTIYYQQKFRNKGTTYYVVDGVAQEIDRRAIYKQGRKPEEKKKK